LGQNPSQNEKKQPKTTITELKNPEKCLKIPKKTQKIKVKT